MEELIRNLLENKNPNDKHTWLTRLTVSFVIVFANLVLYGFYGVLASVVAYLLLVELGGMEFRWMFMPLGIMLLYAMLKALGLLRDYWGNYGHG